MGRSAVAKCSPITSQALGWSWFLPRCCATARTGRSLQLFIEHDPAINFTLDDSFNDQLQRFAAFDAESTMQTARAAICCWMHKISGGIDHGLAFHSAPKLRTVIWSSSASRSRAAARIPASLQNDILCKAAPDRSDAKLAVGQRISALVRRIEAAHDARLPQPEGMAQLPWPPVSDTPERL